MLSFKVIYYFHITYPFPLFSIVSLPSIVVAKHIYTHAKSVTKLKHVCQVFIIFQWLKYI